MLPPFDPTPKLPAALQALATMWLRPDSIVTDGTTVFGWRDVSGNTNHAAQVSSSVNPALAPGAINGYPAVLFSGSKYLSHPCLAEPRTVLIVYKMTGTGSKQSLLAGGVTTKGDAFGAYYCMSQDLVNGSTNLYRSFRRNLTSDTNNYAFASYTQPLFNEWEIYGALNDGGTAIQQCRGGSPLGLPTVTTGTYRAINAGGGYIGSAYVSAGVSYPFFGQIAEVLVFSTQLTAEQYRAASGYLTAKYVLPVPYGPFLFTCFQAHNLNENLWMIQGDGVNFRSRPVHYLPKSPNRVRDPNLLPAWRSGNGKHWVCHTNVPIINAPATTSFDIASSDDLRNFYYVASIDCSAVVSGAQAQVWAPSWFVDTDGSVHVFFCASTAGLASPSGAFTMYEIHPTAADFSAWSTPVVVSGAGFPNNTVDPRMIKYNGTYYLFFTSSGGNITCFSSTSLTTGYASLALSQSWGSGLESPGPVHLGGSNFRIYLDAQGLGYYHSESTTGPAGPWTAKQLLTGPWIPQHGNVTALLQGG